MVRFSNTSPTTENPRDKALAEVHREMSDMVGLQAVKAQIDQIVDFARLKKLRRDRRLPSPPISLHMVFRGPPGTGKTEVARKIAKILWSIRYLNRLNFVEVDRSSFTSQYANETPKVVSSKVDEALNGVLFIDEAYTLAGKSAVSGQPDKAGQEAIDTLMKAMEDHRENLVVICAGYPAEMDRFLDSNPGLKSRFGFIVDFPNYDELELGQIFEGLVAHYRYRLTEAAQHEAKAMLADLARTGSGKKDFGNARSVRQRFEKIVMAQAARVSGTDNLDELTDDQLTTLEVQDIEAAQ